MSNQAPPVVHITANGLPEAWYKAVKECVKNGGLKKREYGLTKDIISLSEINNPLQEPLLHPDFPTRELHLQEYIKQIERGYDWKKQGHEYNYVDRLINYPRTDINSDHTGYYKVKQHNTPTIDQIKTIKEKIAGRIKCGECIVSNRDQAVTWVAERDLFVDEDQPCLQRVQIFIYSFPIVDKDYNSDKDNNNKDDKSNIIPGRGEIILSWRSRDLYGAWNSNMIALILFLKKEIFDPNNIRIIRVVDFCSSLHIYEADWKLASNIRPVSGIRY